MSSILTTGKGWQRRRNNWNRTFSLMSPSNWIRPQNLENKRNHQSLCCNCRSVLWGSEWRGVSRKRVGEEVSLPPGNLSFKCCEKANRGKGQNPWQVPGMLHICANTNMDWKQPTGTRVQEPRTTSKPTKAKWGCETWCGSETRTTWEREPTLAFRLSCTPKTLPLKELNVRQ